MAATSPPPLRQDRPQGFEAGKLAKTGRGHLCFWNCGKVFKTIAEAKDHSPCSGREINDNNVVLMYLLHGKKRGMYDHSNNRGGEKSFINMPGLDVSIRKLPDFDKEVDVSIWVATSPFPSRWPY